MLWFRKQVLSDLQLLLQDPVSQSPYVITLQGEEGMGKSDLITHLVLHLPFNNLLIKQYDLNYEFFSAADLAHQKLLDLKKSGDAVFRSFLENFSPRLQEYILNNISADVQVSSVQQNWLQDLFLQFLTFMAQEKSLLLIFENIHQTDRIRFEELESFIRRISHLPVRVLFTADPEGPFDHDYYSNKTIMLDKLSVQEAEHSIQEYFDTSPINARLLSNHCYLKTGGNPLKIRFLLESLYRPLMNEKSGEFINVRALQNIRISGQWEEIYRSVFASLTEDSQHLLALFAHLGVPVLKADLLEILRALNQKSTIIDCWVNGGFIREVIIADEIYYMLPGSAWKKWIQAVLPVDAIKDSYEILSELSGSGRLKRVYPLSDLLYEANELDASLKLAWQEACALQEQGKLNEASDRLYFIVRIARIDPARFPDILNVLEKLGDIYLKMGAYENAFEILRYLREIITNRAQEKETANPQEWLDVNIKMTRALIAMDAFQEARYLIREMQVKQFCDPESTGACHELQGDIETSLAHQNYAVQEYHKAIEKYRQVKSGIRIYSVYKKLKLILKNQPVEYQALIAEILEFMHASGNVKAFEAALLRDEIQHLLAGKEYIAALKSCIRLRRLLREIYQPHLFIQMTFYFGEIYARLGKWKLAISHFEKIVDSFLIRHKSLLHVQVYIQLGLMYKEQARYGEARRILEQGMELCFRHNYFSEQNEIKLHLGHIYLLVHGLLRAQEYLLEAHNWANSNQQRDILILAKLYLAYYEIQQNRLDPARNWLREAKKLVNLSDNPLDFLNYLFYLDLWMLESDKPAKARIVADLVLKKAGDIPRYQAAAYYLLTSVHAARGNYGEAEKSLQRGLKISHKWHLPQVRYLLYCRGARLAYGRQDDGKFLKELKDACRFIYEIADRILDEILRTQFLEAKYHEDILNWCMERDIRS
ncbi:MAG: tetratricopeptide repeat protein [Calditrichia bacterium]